MQKFGDLKAKGRIDSSKGYNENELSWSLSAEERKMIENYLNENQSLPDGYSLRTKVAEGKISTKFAVRWA